MHVNACLFVFPADRSETAKFLLELSDPAPAGVEDDQGQAAIVWMIAKMPPVVCSTSYCAKYSPSSERTSVLCRK